MIFRPELAEAVMDSRKIVTRRLVSENPRSPWAVTGCKLRPGQSVAVCPGRGKAAIGRVEIVSVRREAFRPLDISVAEARAEGFASHEAFVETWQELHDETADEFSIFDVWRIEFRVLKEEEERAAAVVRNQEEETA